MTTDWPAIADNLCGECRDHYAEVRRGLDLLGIRFEGHPNMTKILTPALRYGR